MDLRVFQKFAKAYTPDLTEDKKLELSGILNSINGRLSKVSDAVKRQNEEDIEFSLGEIMFNIALYANIRKIDLAVAVNTPVKEANTIDWYIHEFSNMISKHVLKDKKISPATEQLYIAEIVKTIFNSCARLAINFYDMLEKTLEEKETSLTQENNN